MARRRRQRGWRRWVEVLVWSAGAAGFLVSGVWMDYDLYVLSSRGVVARADIIGYHGGENPSVEVEFTTAEGERVRGETSNYLDLDIATLEVVYDPQNPDRMQAADYGYPYWLPGLLVAAGVFFVWLSVWTWRYGFPESLRRTP